MKTAIALAVSVMMVGVVGGGQQATKPLQPPPPVKTGDKLVVQPDGNLKPYLGDEAEGYQVNLTMNTTGTRMTQVVDKDMHQVVIVTAPPPEDSKTGWGPHSTACMTSATGKVCRLSDAEYKELLDTPLRDVEAEKVRLAKAHGVELGHPYKPATCRADDMGCIAWNDDAVQEVVADKWVVSGQWLAVGTDFTSEGK